jgi:flagellar protein FlgJ
MRVITMGVGPGKPNHRDDVVVVQRLLNRHLSQLLPLAPLKLDGRCGSQTEETIRQFQARVLNMSKPDGCVDPNGRTMIALAGGPVQAASAKHVHHTPANVNAFVAMALPAARRVSSKWDVPVAVILAQSALETGWGKHVVKNAYFGIKGKSPSGDSTNFATTEVIAGKVIHIKDQFRAYKDYEDSADDYGRFLNENARYRAAFTYKNKPLRFVEEIARAGYATDPNYAASLKNIIRSFGFEQYDKPQGTTLP